MTITYSGEVPNGSSFGCFWKILWKWRGSVYKLVWRELLAYLFLYYSLNLVYRHALTSDQKRIFEKIRQYFGSSTETIPMSFVLGFYVSLVVKRWWEQYRLLPWPDSLALYVSAGIPGNDERGRLMRRNIVRYAVLAYVITLQRVSLRVKRRFPTWQHVVDCGLMLESEKKIIEMMDEKSTMSKYWMPLIWATNIINRARKESLITSDHLVQLLLIELSDIRKRLGGLIGYDTVCVPLVYTQVVTLALYTYFIAALMGRQFVLPSEDGKYEEFDMYFPFFTALQFCFYVGWLKVAEVLINPFGEDDDDIELNWLIDRHIRAAYMIVDEMHEEHPELLKDQYWDEVVPKDLPYTVASEHYRREEPKGSAELYKVKQADAVYANLLPHRKVLHDDMYADYESVDTPLVERRKNWFARQITRMGSVRSASTAYSSGGLFGRGRHNSVYSSPDAGLPPGGLPGPGAGVVLSHKMTLYDRIVGRKSGRQQLRRQSQGNTKLNGSAVPVTLKNRPRIPTPDVTKEVVDRENRLAAAHNIQNHNQISQGVTLMAHQLNSAHANAYPNYTGNDIPVVQVVLSPIQELDGNGSHNNTLHANSPGTAALAQAVLSPTLASAGIPTVLTTQVVSMPSVTMPVTMSHLGLHTSSSSPQLSNVAIVAPATPTLSERNVPVSFTEQLTTQTATVTEINSMSEEEATSETSQLSQASTLEERGGERSRKTSTASQNTITATNSNNTNNNSNNSNNSNSTSTNSSNNNSNSGGKKREVYV